MDGLQSPGEPTARDINGGSNYWQVLIVLIVSWAVRYLFVWYMPEHVRSVDTYSWDVVNDALSHGMNPYKETGMLVWPPFWMQVIFVMGKIAAALNIPMIQVLRMVLTGVESCIVVVLFKLIRQMAPQARPFLLILCGIALNPVTILLTCQHGNFDVFIGLWVLLFAGQLTQYYRSGNEADWLGACFFLGLGILTKTVPLLLCPMLAGGWRLAKWKMRLIGAALVLGPVTLAMSVIYVLAPDDTASKVLAYRSAGAFFGISGLLHLAGADNLIGITNKLFFLVLAASGVVVAVLFWRRRQWAAREIVLCAALLLVALPSIGSGYGPQYFYWFWPLLLASWFVYRGVWRRAVAVFWVIAVPTYLVEYGIIHFHGSYIFWLMDRAHQQLSWQWAVRLNWWVSQSGEITIRLPLFAAFLALLITGICVFMRNLRMMTPASEPIPSDREIEAKNPQMPG